MMGDTTGQPLSVRGLRKRYGKREVLCGVDLNVDSGSICGLVGLNGAGKSTTLACALGLSPFNSGDIQLFGCTPQNLHQLRGKVAAVFDDPCLLPHLTVIQQMQWSQRLTGNRYSDEYFDQLLVLLNIERFRDYTLSELSLGNRRRASIAQALVGDPQLLILDEPFNGLDVDGVELVLDLVQQLRSRGVTCVLASHQLSYLERVCDSLAIIHQGQTVANGRVDTLLQRERHQVRLRISNNSLPLSTVLEKVSSFPAVARIENDNIEQLDTANSIWLQCELTNDDTAALNAALVSMHIAVAELHLQPKSLRELFQQVTGSSSSTSELRELEVVS